MLKIGIIGAGIRGQLFARALSGMPGVTVVAISDPSPRAREAATRTLDVPVFASHADVLDHGVEAVIIATPDFAHVEAAVDAAGSGAHLLIEKPLATTVDDAMRIRDAIRDAGVQGYVAFENRWATTFRQLHTLVHSGELGAVKAQSVRLSNTLEVPTKMLSWAAQSSPAWFLMPHTVDMSLWLSGARVRSVQAQGTRGVLDARGINTWDGVFAMLKLTDGSVVSLESVWSLPESSPSIVDYKFEVIGSDGVSYVDHQDQMLRVTDGSHRLPRTLSARVAGQEQGPAAWMVRSFAMNLLGADEQLPDVDHGLHVTEVIAAVHESLETGEGVELAPNNVVGSMATIAQ